MTKDIYRRLLILVLFTCLPILARADFCFTPFEMDTAEANEIFVGKVVKIERGAFWYGRRPKTIFTFEVMELFKGDGPRGGYKSIIGPIHGCCNEHFKMDSTFLVFAYGDCENSSLLWTNDCSNTGLLSEEQEIYHKLGDAIKYNPIKEDVDYMNSNAHEIDSLQMNIEKLNLHIAAIQEDKSNLNNYLIALGGVVGALSILLIVLRIRS